MRYGIIITMVFVLTGCVTTPTFVTTTRYTLEPAVSNTTASPLPLRLAVRPVESARPYRQQLVYRDNGAQLVPYPHAEWAELPAESITRALIDALRESGRFADVGLVFDMGIPDAMLIARIRRFEEDRTVQPSLAVCEIGFELRDNSDRRAIWTAIVSDQQPLTVENDPAALVAAMNIAAGNVIAQATQAITLLEWRNPAEP